MKRANGYVLWEGISQLDGDTPIVAVATGFTRPSTNLTTGPMIQVWIMPRDNHPKDAQEAVCGDCKIKHLCYVRPDTVYSVWRAYKAGSYPALSSPAERAALLQSRAVRLGAWGDPASLPEWLVGNIHRMGSPVTGYTQAWRRFPILKRYLMASVTNRKDAMEAQRQGWRTFRIRRECEDVEYTEVDCPAKVEDPRDRITCYQCGLCSGNIGPLNVSHVTTLWHGARGKHMLV